MSIAYGVGVIVGLMIWKAFDENDQHKVRDIVLMSLGLAFIVIADFLRFAKEANLPIE